MKAYLEEALAPSSRRTYRQAWSKFETFMTNHLHRPPLPAKVKHVALYTTHLREFGLRSNTIRAHLSAIAYHHKIRHFPNPTDSFVISKLLLSFAKNDSNPKIRLPIQAALLHQILAHIPKLPISTYEKHLFRALFNTMYHAALRVSEVTQSHSHSHNLHLKHITITETPTLACTIKFSSFKHSNKGSTSIKIEASPGKYCPVRALQKYLTQRGTHSGALFIHENRDPLSRLTISDTLNSILTLLHKDPLKYNTHSFRIGKTSDLAQSGASNAQIALVGRWKSAAYTAYIKPKTINSNPGSSAQ